MATPKTWIADDVEMGTVKLRVTDGVLSIMQGYTFIDGLGNKVENLPTKSISASVPFVNLPVNIRTALIDLKDFMYQKALVQEDME